MPRYCAVYGCFSNLGQKGNLSFHKLPKNEETRKTWVHLCKRKDPIDVDRSVVCSLHFQESAYERQLKCELFGRPTPKSQIRLKEGAVPTLHLLTSQGKTEL